MKMKRNGSAWQVWLAAGYAVFTGIWLALKIALGDRYWPLAILNTGAEYLALPLIPLAIMSVLSARRALLLGLLAFPTLVFGWFYGALFLPRWQAAPSGARLTAMTYNVLYSNHDFEALAASIRAAQPDLIGFEELTEAHAEALPALLAADYPYAALSQDTGPMGAGLMSRFPIETSEAFSLPPRNLAMRAVVNMDGRRLRVYVVHLSPNNLLDFELSQAPALAVERYAARKGETEQLQAELAALDLPAIMLCDCNLTDTSAAYATLRAVAGDSFGEAGWGLGHSLQTLWSPVPVQRIDYVWHRHEFYAAAAGVGEPGGSDHRPVWAELVWPP